MQTYETSDIAMTAYLVMRGVELISVSKTANKFRYVFDNCSDLVSKFEAEYLSSDYPRYDAAMRQIKRRLYKT